MQFIFKEKNIFVDIIVNITKFLPTTFSKNLKSYTFLPLC